jgi:hypothetical protein
LDRCVGNLSQQSPGDFLKPSLGETGDSKIPLEGKKFQTIIFFSEFFFFLPLFLIYVSVVKFPSSKSFRNCTDYKFMTAFFVEQTFAFFKTLPFNYTYTNIFISLCLAVARFKPLISVKNVDCSTTVQPLH